LGVQGLKIVRAAAASALYLLLLPLVYVLHARYFTVDVVLYSALADVLLTTGLCSLLLWRLAWFNPLGLLEKLQLVAIWLLVGYALAISVPTVLDRSLSFYLLEKLQQRGGGIRQEALAGIIVDEFMQEHRLVDARLTEQLASGTIVIVDGCVALTPKGRTIASASRAFRSHLLPKRRLLMGEYSDDLTDPFARSPDAVDYACGPAQARPQ